MQRKARERLNMGLDSLGRYKEYKEALRTGVSGFGSFEPWQLEIPKETMKKFVRLKTDIANGDMPIIFERNSDNPELVTLHQGDNHIKVSAPNVQDLLKNLEAIAAASLE
jgi:hypothetical protein